MTINLEHNYCVMFKADTMTKKKKKLLHNVRTNKSFGYQQATEPLAHPSLCLVVKSIAD